MAAAVSDEIKSRNSSEKKRKMAESENEREVISESKGRKRKSNFSVKELRRRLKITILLSSRNFQTS